MASIPANFVVNVALPFPFAQRAQNLWMGGAWGLPSKPQDQPLHGEDLVRTRKPKRSRAEAELFDEELEL